MFTKRSLFIILWSILVLSYAKEPTASTEINETPQFFAIEGTASLRPDMKVPKNWQANSQILVDHGKYTGFIREDGSFKVQGLPSGSYIVEISNTDYIFEPVRVDITSKGKIRARKLNLLQPNKVDQIPYPLQIVARQPTKYFRAREEWRITDMLMNPMVIMLLVAFLLMIITPKLAANDPQLQKEMQNMQMPKMEMPDLSETLASFFGGPQGNKKAAAKKQGAGGNKKNR